ncbi:serine hydrolase-like protein [Clupea harengus]|uniref:Serine hydrolase-like protein n=1 Tax=Clupea harengus TaxID=7950 RepID=A0A6P3VY70_CLUHA|nr:serine hydrolase-like protein [Clupea harengus]XP_031417660.1 serine hydrolase-like protein [Clupea harengus]XP_031417661.1 serine hydrolase-like protein [Clupea harengus]XP_031417662.1 serine hydrolase-like protein [Clupea harengus]XP_031417663.1 serine hydrolase-like protein [Clupea harengus]
MKRAASEFRLPVPWGELRGQVWGPEEGRPILCLHGWADNSGSFNTLIPLLPQEWRCVAVDMAGHGLSSPRPPGVFYTFPAYITDVRRVVEALQWKRFSILGHSMGGNVAGMFSALFPEMVEGLVLLDSYGFLPTNTNELPGIVRQGIEEMVRLEETEKDGKKERIYTYEKAMQRLMAANPHLSEQSAKNLLERGIREVEGGFVFTRDFRLNLKNVTRNSLEQCLEYQSRIQARVLLLMADAGLNKSFPLPEGCSESLMNGYQRSKNMKVMTVSGDHHVHMNQPEGLVPIITDFLQSVGSAQATENTAKL